MWPSGLVTALASAPWVEARDFYLPWTYTGALSARYFDRNSAGGFQFKGLRSRYARVTGNRRLRELMSIEEQLPLADFANHGPIRSCARRGLSGCGSRSGKTLLVIAALALCLLVAGYRAARYGFLASHVSVEPVSSREAHRYEFGGVLPSYAIRRYTPRARGPPNAAGLRTAYGSREPRPLHLWLAAVPATTGVEQKPRGRRSVSSIQFSIRKHS